MSLDRPTELPFLDPRTARPPGLAPLDPAALVSLDADFAAQMARRDRLIGERPDRVIARTPEGDAPARELLAHVAEAALLRPGFAREGTLWRRPDGGRVAIDPARPLASLGRMVAEDWALLMPDAEAGEPRLVAAVVCFPSRWDLSEKIGRPLTAIHGPVPGYAGGLAPRVNRVFETLRPGRPLWRANWLIHATDEPHLPLGETDKMLERAEAEVADGPLYLRTERQTLTRLPETGAAAFGIKTSITPLEALTGEEAAALARALRALDEPTVAYRRGRAMRDAALERLGAIAAGR